MATLGWRRSLNSDGADAACAAHFLAYASGSCGRSILGRFIVEARRKRATISIAWSLLPISRCELRGQCDRRDREESARRVTRAAGICCAGPATR